MRRAMSLAPGCARRAARSLRAMLATATTAEPYAPLVACANTVARARVRRWFIDPHSISVDSERERFHREGVPTMSFLQKARDAASNAAEQARQAADQARAKAGDP